MASPRTRPRRGGRTVRKTPQLRHPIDRERKRQRVVEPHEQSCLFRKRTVAGDAHLRRAVPALDLQHRRPVGEPQFLDARATAARPPGASAPPTRTARPPRARRPGPATQAASTAARPGRPRPERGSETAPPRIRPRRSGRGGPTRLSPGFGPHTTPTASAVPPPNPARCTGARLMDGRIGNRSAPRVFQLRDAAASIFGRAPRRPSRDLPPAESRGRLRRLATRSPRRPAGVVCRAPPRDATHRPPAARQRGACRAKRRGSHRRSQRRGRAPGRCDARPRRVAGPGGRDLRGHRDRHAARAAQRANGTRSCASAPPG